jgi:hypothetical protein
MLFQEDAAMVCGIPFMGKEVWDASLDKSDSMRKKIEDIIGMGSESRTPRQASIKTLKSLAGREISVSEEEVFKVAFSVYIVSMLCDSNNPGDVDSVNFWPAISVASDIHKFNWASYVLDSVFSACVCARKATRTNTHYSPPAGTAIFLQVWQINISPTMCIMHLLTYLKNKSTHLPPFSRCFI